MVQLMQEIKLEASTFEAIAREKIIFGHQSIGGNIIEGIKSILAYHPNKNVRIILINNQNDFDKPGLLFFLLAKAKIQFLRC